MAVPIECGQFFTKRELISRKFLTKYFYRFSVNFTIDNSPNPENIAYHFKVDFERNVIIENYKATSWYDESVMDNYYFDRASKY